MLIFTKFLRLSLSKKWLVVEAFVLLGLARLAIIKLPFRLVAKVLGESESDLTIETIGQISSNPQVENIAWAVRRVGCHTPWRSNCLAKAVAGRLMLRRRQINSTLYFGVKKNSDGEILAHAWLRSGEKTLTGGSNLELYSIVAKFTD